MWLKLLLFTSYLVFLFVLCRILEGFTSYNDTGSFVTSFVVLDPISLSVKKLKELLDNRGVSYSGVFERPELVELVKSSGHVTKEELIEALILSKTVPETTHFTGGPHFYEEVEDTKDSAWLVQVEVEGTKSALLSKESWEEIRKKAGNFGVRTGVFTCSSESRLCHRKGWTTSRLILALPRGHKAKEDVVLHNHLLPSTTGSVLNWVRKHLSSRVHNIETDKELEKWMASSDSGENSEIKILFFSFLKSCPMFLSSMAIKFNGRVKVGTVDVTAIKSHKKFIKSEDIPGYFIITPEKISSYGSRRGESYNSKSLELYLRTLVPEMNDVFICSLLLTNVLAAFQLFFMSNWLHFFIYTMCLVKYNSALFLLWLSILALYQFPAMLTLTEISLQSLRYLSDSSVAAVLRNDYKYFYSNYFLLSTFCFFAGVSGYFLKKAKWVQLDEEDTILSTFQNLAAPRRIVPTFPEIDLEAEMNHFVERLSVPNFYLQPLLSMNYIRYLPMWTYQGWCDADDELEQRRDLLFSSDDESVSNIPSVPKIETRTSNSDDSNTVSKSSDESSQDQNSKTVEISSGIVRQSESVMSSPSSNSVSQKSRAPEGMLELRKCSICLESYRYTDFLCGLPCGHNFHANCILNWLLRGNHCCPICRRASYRMGNAMPHPHSQ